MTISGVPYIVDPTKDEVTLQYDIANAGEDTFMMEFSTTTVGDNVDTIIVVFYSNGEITGSKV